MYTHIAPENIYAAGQKAPAGIYRQIDGNREVSLEHEDVLPATCDGHATIYLRRPENWGEMQKQAKAK